MKEAEHHWRLYRHLRFPVVDTGEGALVSHKAIKVDIAQVPLFKERSLKSLCMDEVFPKQIEPAFDMLADGGCLVTCEITDEIIKRLRPKYKYQVIRVDPFTVIKRLSGSGGEVPYIPPKGPKPGQKTVCMARYGAFGDHLMVTPLIQHYRDEGWHITYNCTNKGEWLFKNDPRIDDLMVQEDNILSADRVGMTEFWNKLAKGYDKFIPLSEVVEGNLLRLEGTKEYHDSHLKRRLDCCKNYIDAHFSRAGLDITGRLPSIPLSDAEREFARREVDAVRKKLGKSFIVLWNVFGSAYHKAYPWMFDVWWLIKQNRDDIGILAVGDDLTQFVVGNEFNGIVHNAGAKYKIRQSLTLHSAVDAVVTPETWSLTAAQAFDAPMIALLSHSDPKNFTWRDKDIVLTPPLEDCPCFPCHQLHHSKSGCLSGTLSKGSTACMDSITPASVYQSLMTLRSRHGDHFSRAS